MMRRVDKIDLDLMIQHIRRDKKGLGSMETLRELFRNTVIGSRAIMREVRNGECVLHGWVLGAPPCIRAVDGRLILACCETGKELSPKQYQRVIAWLHEEVES